MKLKDVFICLLVAFLLPSCVDFHNSKISVWAGGVWLIPCLTGIPALILWIDAIIASRSGSTHQDLSPTSPTFGQNVPDKGNVSITKVWPFKYAVGLTLATIAIIIIQVASR